MRNPFTTAVTILAVGMMLLGIAVGQQAPATKTKDATAAKTAANSQNPSALQTEKDKVSYAIGMNIGRNLHKDSIDVDPNLLLRGMKDAMAGGKTLLTDDEAKSAMMTLQNDLRQKQEAKAQQAGQTNKTEGEAFLAANKTKEGVVTLPSGLQYKILKEGTGPKPTSSDTVACKYKGTLLDGTEFDSSDKHGGQPVTFTVGQVIKGWSEAIQLMPVGSKWQLFVPSDLAYGQHGAGADIPPNATLIFEVELLSIQSK